MIVRWRTGFIAAGTLCAAAIVGSLLHNNWPQPPPDAVELSAALERALNWVAGHRAALLAEPQNHILWWMLAAADERLGGDARLEEPLREYFALPSGSGTQGAVILKLLFARNVVLPAVPLAAVRTLRPDQQLMVYGLTCSAPLAALPSVREQLTADACPVVWMMQPHCATHQRMSLLWASSQGCVQAPSPLTTRLEGDIRRQLTLDARVDEAYLQRTLILVAARGCEAVRPAWVRRILEQQLPDGGWEFDYPTLPLPFGRALLLGTRGIAVRTPTSQLHATAQAILLLSYLVTPVDRRRDLPYLAHWASPAGSCPAR
jgi:hypothetical protein